MNKLAQCFNTAAQDLNPGSRSWESTRYITSTQWLEYHSIMWQVNNWSMTCYMTSPCDFSVTDQQLVHDLLHDFILWLFCDRSTTGPWLVTWLHLVTFLWQVNNWSMTCYMTSSSRPQNWSWMTPARTWRNLSSVQSESLLLHNVTCIESKISHSFGWWYSCFCTMYSFHKSLKEAVFMQSVF